MDKDEDILLTPLKYTIALTIFALAALLLIFILAMTKRIPDWFAYFCYIITGVISGILIIIDIILFCFKIKTKK